MKSFKPYNQPVAESPQIAGQSSGNETVLSIADMAFVLGSRSPAGQIALLHAYLDDSGTHDGSEVILLAGLVAPVAVWARIEADWLKVLADEGIKRFHRTECEAADGEFVGWSRPRRDHLYFKLRQTLDGVLLRSSHVIYRRDWEDIVVGRYPELVPTLGSPYRMVISECIQKTALWADETQPASEKVAFLLDHRPQNTAHDAEIGFKYAQNPKWKPRIASFTFVSSGDFRLMEAADLYAHDLYQQHMLRMKDADAFKTQPHMRAIAAKVPAQRAGHLDRRWLKKYCASIAPMLRREGVIA
jgi:hypothetical protein